MIKTKYKNSQNQEVIFFGLDKENIRRLKKGDPIYIKGRDIGISQDIAIAYADTLSEIQKEYNIPHVN